MMVNSNSWERLSNVLATRYLWEDFSELGLGLVKTASVSTP